MIPYEIKSDRNSGVALIIVLGLVAVLMITTVAFTTTMHVERASSANLRHATLARQIVKGALAYALADLDYSINTYSADPTLPSMWHEQDDLTQLCWDYERKARQGNEDVTFTLWKDTLVSIWNPEDEDNVASVVSAEAEHYILPGLAYKGFGKKLLGGAEETIIDQPQWIPIMPTGKDVTGRFAYMIFNNSGLLDVNVVDREPRRLGMSPKEITICPELFSPSEFNSEQEVESFLAKRDSIGEFASVAELLEYGNVKGGLSSFDTYSYQPSSYTNGFAPVDLTKPLSPNKDAVVEAFYRSGLVVSSDGYTPQRGQPDSEQAYCAYLALTDYVDSDSRPAGKNDQEKFCRPVSEEFPVMSGGEALITVTRTQIETKTTDPATGLQVPAIDNKKCMYELRIIGKIPFVWNFDKKFSSEETVICEGKMAVINEGSGTFDGFFENDAYKNKSVITMSAEYTDSERIVSPIRNDDPSDWILTTSMEVEEKCFDVDADVIPYEKIKADPDYYKNHSTKPDIDDLEFTVCFAGSTYFGSVKDENRVRICPFDKVMYKKTSSDLDGIKDSWPYVTFSAKKEKVEFSPAQGDDPYKVKTDVTVVNDGKPETKSVNLARWVAHKIVWVEFTDPNFASFAMREMDSEILRQCGFYRPSVDPSLKKDSGALIDKIKTLGNLMNGAPTQYLKLLSTTRDKFSEFNGADVEFDRKNEIKSYGKTPSKNTSRDEDDLDVFIDCGYFSGKGSSPLIDFILENADIIGGTSTKSSLGIYSDGLQFGSGGKSCDKSFMHRRRYVGNKGLESVGELGYIQVGPYSTIKLYDHGWGSGLGDDPFEEMDQLSGDYPNAFRDFSGVPGYGVLSAANMSPYRFKPLTMKVKGGDGKISPDACGYHTVLDYFSVNPDVERGKISLNTSSLKVLASAYYDMPINNDGFNNLEDSHVKRFNKERSLDMASLLSKLPGGLCRLSDFGKIYKVPGEGNGNREIVITESTRHSDLSKGAQILVAAIADSSDPLTSVVSGGTGFGSIISEAEQVKTENKNKRFGEFEREALIRNACGLFGDGGGQVFTIILRAESFSPDFGRTTVTKGTVNAAKTAVAQVWRDNIPRETDISNSRKVKINPFIVRYFKIIDE